MKQVIKFYFLCCFSNLLFHFVSAFISSGLQDIKFGFSIVTLFVCMFYSPLCTFLACVYKISKINVHIIKYPLSYSLFPFIVTGIISYIFNMGVVFRDKLMIALFVAENVLIISWSCYYYKRKRDIN